MKSWRWTFRKVLSDPVDEELLGRLSCPAASCVVKVTNVLGLIFFHNCKEKRNKRSAFLTLTEASDVLEGFGKHGWSLKRFFQL